jgi:carbonic anhydrase/acetyltransferase-like protein (isoleucine patch superfamily)
MAIYRLGDLIPAIDPEAWVAESAELIGRVELAAGASVWFNATLRADNDRIVVGARSNIQDGTVIHTDDDIPVIIGEGVTVGHQVMLHGCTIGNGSLIGIQAVILNRARIGRECLIGAGSLITAW